MIGRNIEDVNADPRGLDNPGYANPLFGRPSGGLQIRALCK
jgi:hypothetical protein